MQDKRLLLVISILVGVLFILVIITSLLGLKFNSSNQNQNISPTPFASSRKYSPAPTLNPLQKQQMIIEVKQESKPLSSDQASSLSNLDSKLPVTTDDFEIGKSDVVDQYFIHKKTSQADEKLQQFLHDNGISDLNDYNKNGQLFVQTNDSVGDAINKAENQFLLKKDQGVAQDEQNQQQSNGQTQETTTPQPEPTEATANKDVQLLSDLLKTLLSFNLGESGAGGGGGSQTLTSPSSLADIFSEAGSKVGISPKLLESFMKVECGSIFSLPADKIQEYSTPGNGLPPDHRCFGNSYGAHGPMQFIYSTWAHYATSVNRYGGYSYTPYIENIRDSVYAAAEKIKSDGRASNPQLWTQDEVYRGAKAYCGSCNQAKACPNYCEHVWNNYTQ